MKTITFWIALTCLLCLSACAAKPAGMPAESSVLTQMQTALTQRETEESVLQSETHTQTEPVSPQPAKTQVYIEEDLRAVKDYHLVVADPGDPMVQVVFTTDQTIRDVQVLSLTATGFDETRGTPVYDVHVVDTLASITPQYPLVMMTVFHGDMPNNGIAYTDTDGTVRRFAVEMSGEDGHVFLTAF